MNTPDLTQSVTDLSQTCDELTYLANTARERLIPSKHPLLPPLQDTYQTLSDELQVITTRLRHNSHSDMDGFEMHESLAGIEMRLRNLQGVMGAALCALDWQSPSFAASQYQQAGRETGTVRMGINDYKRDQHAAGITYESWFRRAFVSPSPISGVKVYATSSGMAAFSTILGFLRGEQKCNGPILVGKSCYFEEKNLLHALFPTQIIEIDEHDLTSIKNAIEIQKPHAVFFDSVCNSLDMALPDIPALIDTIRKQKRKDIILVVDNTGLSASFQPLRYKRLWDPYIQIIVWESLLKHHQFGMDRGNGGIIYSSARDDIKLYDWRDHLGTNIAESVVLSFPIPNKKLLMNRLFRHERNNTNLARSLGDHAIFPGLVSHPSSPWSNTLRFHGAFLTIKFDRRHQNIRSYKRFLSAVFAQAKKEHINLVGGSSFGFSTTRIYVPASYGHQADPFVRIAIGTEPLMINNKIVEIITQTVKEF